MPRPRVLQSDPECERVCVCVCAWREGGDMYMYKGQVEGHYLNQWLYTYMYTCTHSRMLVHIGVYSMHIHVHVCHY